MKSENLRKKSEELASESEELKEKIYEAEHLEKLLDMANKAEWLITDILSDIGEVDIQEPHGWLSEIMHNLVTEIESKLERI